MPQSKNKTLSKSRIILFKGISIVLIPLLVLFLLEITLRLSHYGHNLNLFIDYKGNNNYLVLNPEASKKYFTDQDIATTGNTEPFKKKKDANTLRIFVLGESTTIGYPFFHNGSFHRWLQYRLMHELPDKNLEIINLSLTAVNSYTVVGFAKDVVNYEPDAVFIYTGHNEYYGALGVGSTQNMGSSPGMVKLVLYLREFKIWQLISKVTDGIKKIAGSDKRQGASRMQLMVSDPEIPYQSDLYKKGVKQFADNMDEVVRLFSKKHIPLYLSNLVSNEKDLKPFISSQPGSLKYPLFQKNYAAGLNAFNANNLLVAERYFTAANELYDSQGLCNFYLGTVFFKKGDLKQAQRYFIRAKDLDGLRFRAPEQFNQIISELCRKYPGTYLVDTKAVFEAYAHNHIIGDELTVDHVHPNLMGYALMADAFYTAMINNHLIKVDQTKAMSFKQLLQEMPITRVDSIAGMDRIKNLKKRWPYNDTTGTAINIATDEEKLAADNVFNNVSWPETMNKLYDYYYSNHQLIQAKKVLETVLLENPTNTALYEKIAMLSGEIKDYNSAVFYFKKSFDLVPSFNKARYLFVLCLKLDKPVEALPYVDYAISNNTTRFNLQAVKTYIQQVISLKQVYAANPKALPVLNRIAQTYYKMDNTDGAQKYADEVLEIDDKNIEARQLLEQIKTKRVNNGRR
jgi:tetratricopeptide (TPR) repeat protein